MNARIARHGAVLLAVAAAVTGAGCGAEPPPSTASVPVSLSDACAPPVADTVTPALRASLPAVTLAAASAPSVPDGGGGPFLGQTLPRRVRLEAEQALPVRPAAVEPGTLPMPVTVRSHPDIGQPRHGSISVGTVTTGHLVNGRYVPASGVNHEVLAEHRTRGTSFGTDEAVDAILEAAQVVAAAYPGSKLGVGNLTKGGGGDIPWSVSHNSGRDIDLAYYLVDDQGNPVLLPTFVPLLPPDGTAVVDGRTVHFDPARNWLLVKFLLTSGRVRPLYLFSARFLVRRMLDHARSIGEDKGFLAGLGPVLRQPMGAQPHDDHMHLRIACSADDVADGCREVRHGVELIPDSDPGYLAAVGAARAVLEDLSAPAERRGDAARLLGILKAREARPLLLSQLRTCADQLCAALLEGLDLLGASIPAELLVRTAAASSDPAAVLSALRHLRRAPARAARLVLPLLADPRSLVQEWGVFQTAFAVRAEAALALGWLGDARAIPALLPLLADPELEVRRAALFAVRAITGAAVFPDDAVAAPVSDPAAGFAQWPERKWSRMAVFGVTLRARGYRVRKLGPEDAFELVRAVLDEDWVSLNAQRALSRAYRVSLPIDLVDRAAAQRRWKQEIEARR